MNNVGRHGFRWAFATACVLGTPTATAQWQPQWSTFWQHPEAFVSASGLRVRVANDGATCAAASVTHHNTSHVALMRFDADGNFEWLQEYQASVDAGMVFIGANRIAMTGNVGSVFAPVDIRVYDTNSGVLIWDRQSQAGHVSPASIYDTPQLAVDASGNLMALASDQGDYVVIRFDPDGNGLPTWRYQVEADSDVTATSIVALPDGGAVITGRGQPLHGNVTVRLDASGNEVFSDTEITGPHPFGPGYIGLANDGSIIVAAARETSNGTPLVRVWKMSATGARLWTKFLPNPDFSTGATMLGGFALGADGDPRLVIDKGAGAPFTLVRLDGVSGEVVAYASAPINGNPTSLTLADNGRALIGGFGSGGGQVSTRMAEFTASGVPCRVSGDNGIKGALNVAAGPNGWHVFGGTIFVPGVGNSAVTSRYDSDGNCTLTDDVFADGFESASP